MNAEWLTKKTTKYTGKPTESKREQIENGKHIHSFNQSERVRKAETKTEIDTDKEKRAQKLR